MTEFDPSDWRAYDTVNDFFIRNLRPGARPIAYPNDDNYVVSPADARLYGFQHVPAVCSRRYTALTKVMGGLPARLQLIATCFPLGLVVHH